MKSKAHAYNLAVKIMKVIEELPKDMSSQMIATKLLRSATSIGHYLSNIGDKTPMNECASFFNSSLRSCRETDALIRELHDGFVISKDAAELLSQEIHSMLSLIESDMQAIENIGREDGK